MLSWWSHRLTWWFINNLQVDFVPMYCHCYLTREAVVVVHPSFPNIILFCCRILLPFWLFAHVNWGGDDSPISKWFAPPLVPGGGRLLEGRERCWLRKASAFPTGSMRTWRSCLFLWGWCLQFIKSPWVFWVAREAQEWQVQLYLLQPAQHLAAKHHGHAPARYTTSADHDAAVHDFTGFGHLGAFLCHDSCCRHLGGEGMFHGFLRLIFCLSLTGFANICWSKLTMKPPIRTCWQKVKQVKCLNTF